MVNKYKKEELEDLLIKQNLSYEKVGRMYNVTGAAIKKAALRLGLELKARRKINECETFGKGVYRCERGACLNCGKEIIKYANKFNKFCSIKCSCEYQKKEFIEKWKNGEIDGTMNNGFVLSKIVRNYIYEKYNYSCNICGCNDKNPYTGKSICQIHHIDGNPHNSKEDNLQLLCPNCHAKTENYGSRNKNGDNARTLYYKRAKTQ